MKSFKTLIFTAIALLWALPASALQFEQRVQGIIDIMGPELVAYDSLSIWIAIDRDEFDLFDAADYALRFELDNTDLVSSTGTLVIEALSEAGALLSTSSSIAYNVDTMFFPFILTIPSGTPQTIANTFVANAPAATRQIRIRSTLDVDVLDCDQSAEMEADFLYGGFPVDSDDVVVPPLLICP